jgi:Zn-dependent alcohol dehydrogenase
VRGGYAEQACLPEDAWVRVPPGIPFEVSCGLGPASAVALNAVRDTARVTVGENVLVTGATGGVGWSAVQLARLAGARVIALTATGQLRPRVAAMLPLTEVARAHTLVESGAVSGRIVLIHAHHPSYPPCGDTP